MRQMDAGPRQREQRELIGLIAGRLAPVQQRQEVGGRPIDLRGSEGRQHAMHDGVPQARAQIVEPPLDPVRASIEYHCHL